MHAAAVTLHVQDESEHVKVAAPPTMCRVGNAPGHVMVPLRDAETLARAERDDRACREAGAAIDDAESLYLFAVRGPGDVVARMFDRSRSIGEDPATGSAAGPLGAYLAEHGQHNLLPSL